MKLSEAEWTVMNALWQQSPASARDVLEIVGNETEWAYTTLKTILSRLAEKGAVGIRKRANQSIFVPLVSREDARRSAVRSLLERAFDGTFGSLVQHMVTQEKLSAGEKKKLAAMLAKLDENGK